VNVRLLRERLEEAQHDCEESSSQVSTLSERLESDRNALRQAVVELGETVEASTKQLSDDMVEAETALAEVATAQLGEFWVDGHMRNIPDHFHAHARPKDGFFGRDRKR